MVERSVDPGPVDDPPGNGHARRCGWGGVIVLLAVFGGCDSVSPSASLSYQFIGRDTILLQQTPEDVVASISDAIAWGDRIALVDARESNVKVFDLEGRLNLVIGRKGQGPGEFTSPVAAAALADGSLAVRDVLLQRISFFDEQGEFLRSWSAPVFSVDGLVSLPDGDLLLPGRMAAEREVISDSTVHRFDIGGHRVRSYGRREPESHFGESSFNTTLAAVTGGILLTIPMTSNVVRFVDLSSDRVWSDTLARGFYRPIQWTLRPGLNDAEQEAWFHSQMVVSNLTALGNGFFAVGFREWPDSVPAGAHEWVLRWVFVRPGVPPVVVSDETDFRPMFVRDGSMYSIRQRVDGQVEVLVGPVPVLPSMH